ncbi:glycoside hydrolase [Auricularia subglabra TFB-10046 SS5]|nr:glycoside hydrolase [Auricularia subglabra TFB-10046 SS5]
MSRTPRSTTKPYSAQSSFLSPTLPPTSRAPSRTGSVRSAAHIAPPPVPVSYVAEKTPHARAHARRRRYCALGSVALVLVALAVVLPIVFTVGRRHKSSPGSGASGDSCDGCEVGAGGVLIGRDGATVTTRDGNRFVYRNAFGGYFVQDPNNAYNDGAKAQSFTPALNESWTWGTNKVRGVNLGGWLVPEPFIAPAMYQKYLSTGTLTGDEWTLSLAMQAAGDKDLNELKEHYKTFITEEDFAQISGAGLNWVRLPIPFWALETSASANDWPGEPFLKGASWTYVLLAFEWVRKYGLRVNLDLHTLPGAQNPWVHAGRAGEVNFVSGVMGYANAQRGLDYMRVHRLLSNTILLPNRLLSAMREVFREPIPS